MIPVNEPILDGDEAALLKECIDTGWISSEGPFVRQFEEEFARRCGRKSGIAVCNGSAAIDLALAAGGIAPGDEVILPAFTIISCATAVVRAGAKPLLVDSDERTWNMDPRLLEETVRRRLAAPNPERLKAIMVAHIYGLPTDMDPVMRLADAHGLKVIEDAAEMHGQTYRGRPCGSFGLISTFSFYPNKHITTGEGGMVLCDDPAVAERARSFRNLCFDKERRYIHEEMGWNFRMSNLQAAVGLAQLRRLDEFVGRKRRMGAQYTEALKGLPGAALPVPATDYAKNIYWVYGILLDESHPLDALGAMARLKEKGVQTRHFFWPMHLQPCFRKLGLFEGESHPVSERMAKKGFYLPSGMALTEAQVAEAARAVKEVLA